MNKLTKLGYLNSTGFRNNVKDLPSKIKEEGYNNAYKDNVLIQKYQDKKLFYLDLIIKYYLLILKIYIMLKIYAQFKELQKNGIKKYYYLVWMQQ